MKFCPSVSILNSFPDPSCFTVILYVTDLKWPWLSRGQLQRKYKPYIVKSFHKCHVNEKVNVRDVSRRELAESFSAQGVSRYRLRAFKTKAAHLFPGRVGRPLLRCAKKLKYCY